MMTRASTDPIVAAGGKRAYIDCLDRISDSLLSHRAEITHPDPEGAVAASFNLIYAAFARFLGFGSSITAVGQGDLKPISARW